jgi:hypothetical protein
MRPSFEEDDAVASVKGRSGDQAHAPPPASWPFKRRIGEVADGATDDDEPDSVVDELGGSVES